jgi:hypothetical protein
MGSGKGARTAARLFRTRPRQARPSDRRRGSGPQAHRALLHLLTKGEDYLCVRPALVANKTRAMELQAGHTQQKGSHRGPAYAYNVKALRNQETLVAPQAERSYERFVAQWEPRRPKDAARGAPQIGRA